MNIQETFDALIENEQIGKAIAFAKADHDNSMKEHKEFIMCESPTFNEKKRAAMYAERLKDNGIDDVVLDDYVNVYGYRRGTGNGPTVLVEAHMDTVFPFGSVKEIRDENGIMYAPGCTDDTRGMTAVLAALRAMNEAGIKTKGDIIFAGTSREEGMGGLGGMRDLIKYGPKADTSISVDGASTEHITYQATGFKTYKVVFKGIGGHAYCDFGDMANPLHAAARAVAKIADFEVPKEPKTTFCVSNFHAGNDAGIHAIVPEATIKFNIRSDSQEILDNLEKRCFAAIQEACDEETARWGKDTITWISEKYVDVPAGPQDPHTPVVEAALIAGRYFTPEENKDKVELSKGGCVNGNMAIGAGIPCVTIGGGPLNGKVHSLDEYFPYTEAYRLPQEIVVLLCMAAGVEGICDSIIR